MEEGTPLKKLLVGKGEIDEELLYDILKEYVKIESSSGETVFTDHFANLDARKKIIVLLLAQKARGRLGFAKSEELSPQDVSSMTGLPGGTVRPHLRSLLKERLVSEKLGKYSVPNYGLASLRAEMSPAGA